MPYSNEELTLIINNHTKQLENNTKDINIIRNDVNEIKTDGKITKLKTENIEKMVSNLYDDKENGLKKDSGRLSNLKWVFITAIITSIGGGIGAFIVGKLM